MSAACNAKYLRCLSLPWLQPETEILAARTGQLYHLNYFDRSFLIPSDSIHRALGIFVMRPREVLVVKRIPLIAIALTFCSILLLAVSAREDAEALQKGPISLPDCAANGSDCCLPVCKQMITACCVDNKCGLPKADVVKGKGPWSRMSVSCSSVDLYN